MKNKKLSAIIFILTVILMTALVIGVSGCFFDRKTYELNLPKSENLKSISIKLNAEDLVIDSSDEMENFLKLLNGNGRTTKNESVQDTPINADEVIIIDFNFSETGVSMIFVYQKNNKYYIEQPYNGIYQINADNYTKIKGIIS